MLLISHSFLSCRCERGLLWLYRRYEGRLMKILKSHVVSQGFNFFLFCFSDLRKIFGTTSSSALGAILRPLTRMLELCSRYLMKKFVHDWFHICSKCNSWAPIKRGPSPVIFRPQVEIPSNLTGMKNRGGYVKSTKIANMVIEKECIYSVH